MYSCDQIMIILFIYIKSCDIHKINKYKLIIKKLTYILIYIIKIKIIIFLNLFLFLYIIIL